LGKAYTYLRIKWSRFQSDSKERLLGDGKC